jgi:hypothetical protein
MLLSTAFVCDRAADLSGKLGRTRTIAQVDTTGTPITFDTVAMPRLRGGEAGLDGLKGERAIGCQGGAAVSLLTTQDEA